MIRELDEIESPHLLQLLEWWKSAGSGERLPLRRDFDPVHYPRLWPYLLICDVERNHAENLHFIYRYAGTQLERNFKTKVTGKDITEMPIEDALNSIFDQFLRTAEERRPTYCEHEFITSNQRFVHYVRLLLPASKDGNTVDFLIGACHFLRAWEESP